MSDVSHRSPDNERRQIPAWLLGLIIAALLFVIGFFVFGALGFGDDPVIGQVLIPSILASHRWETTRLFPSNR